MMSNPQIRTPNKYTPATVAKIVKALKLGATIEQAAGYGGIHRATLYTWIETYPDFKDQIELAKDARTAKWLTRINSASATQWQAAAWLLERTDPENYGRQLHELSGRNGKPIETADATDYRSRLVSKLSKFARSRSGHIQEPDQ